MHDAKARRADHLEAIRRRAFRRGQGDGLLGPGAPGLRREGLPLGLQDIRGPEPGAERHQTPVIGPPRGDHRRAGTQACRRRRRPHQAGRGPRGEAARARAHRRRPGRALHGGPCRGALQRAHPGDLRGLAEEPHPARVRRDGGGLRRPGGGCSVSLPPAGDAPCREPGADGSLQDVLAGGGLGNGAGKWQPVPVRIALQGGPSRALSERGGVPAGWPGAVRAGGGGPGAGAGCGGAAADHADGMPRGGGADAEVERHRPQVRGVSPARCEDGTQVGTFSDQPSLFEPVLRR